MFIIISAPMYRCGTTLVQRLLNTTDECIIYGENNSVIGSIYSILTQVSLSKTKSENQWNLFKQDKNCWSANIGPSMTHAMNASLQFLFTMYATPGYMKYGLKALSCAPQHVNMLSDMFGSDFKMIYCIRSFEEAYDSYKNIYDWMSKGQLRVVYDQSIGIATMNSPNVLCVEHEKIDHSKCKEILEFVDCKYDSTIVNEVLNLKLREEPNYVRK